MRWTITREVLDELAAHAREARPRECCGVLIGTPFAAGPSGAASEVAGAIVGARRAANLSADPNRFELDAHAHVAAIRETRGTPQSVVGFYHSHPHSPAIPSPRDLEESTYPDAVHLIIGFADPSTDAADTRAYVLRADGFDEVGLEMWGGG